MAQNLKLLIVEDSPDDAALLVHELLRNEFNPQWSRVETELDFLQALNQEPDIIFSDYFMPQFSGLRALELLQESGLDIPLLLISGTVGEDLAVEAMRQGATDYLVKDRTVRLPSAVQRALREKRLRQERREADEKIKSQLRELKRWHELTLGREDRIHLLKSEVNELLAQAGKSPRYASQED